MTHSQQPSINILNRTITQMVVNAYGDEEVTFVIDALQKIKTLPQEEPSRYQIANEVLEEFEKDNPTKYHKLHIFEWLEEKINKPIKELEIHETNPKKLNEGFHIALNLYDEFVQENPYRTNFREWLERRMNERYDPRYDDSDMSGSSNEDR